MTDTTREYQIQIDLPTWDLAPDTPAATGFVNELGAWLGNLLEHEFVPAADMEMVSYIKARFHQWLSEYHPEIGAKAATLEAGIGYTEVDGKQRADLVFFTGPEQYALIISVETKPYGDKLPDTTTELHFTEADGVRNCYHTTLAETQSTEQATIDAVGAMASTELGHRVMGEADPNDLLFPTAVVRDDVLHFWVLNQNGVVLEAANVELSPAESPVGQ